MKLKHWDRYVRREAPGTTSNDIYVVTLVPPTDQTVPEILVHIKGRPSSARSVTFGQLYAILAQRAAGIVANGRKARRV